MKIETKNVIRIGVPAEYEPRYGHVGFAVFRKTLGAKVTYLIAKDVQVGDGVLPPVPSGPLREYDTQDEAVLALDKWATARRDEPLLKPQKSAVDICRNSSRPRLKKPGPGQMDLAFPE